MNGLKLEKPLTVKWSFGGRGKWAKQIDKNSHGVQSCGTLYKSNNEFCGRDRKILVEKRAKKTIKTAIKISDLGSFDIIIFLNLNSSLSSGGWDC